MRMRKRNCKQYQDLRCAFAHTLYSPTPQRSKTTSQPTKRTTHTMSAKQNPYRTTETPHSQPVSEANPRSNRRNTTLTHPQRSKTSHRPRSRVTHIPSAKQNLGPTNRTPHPLPVSGAKPRPNRRNTPPTPPQRSKTTIQPTKHPTHATRGMRLSQTAGHAM